MRMENLAVPGLAIATYERVHDLLVTVHDFTGRLTAHLPQHAIHRHPLCHAAKAVDAQACIRFDAVQLPELLVRHREGLVQRCHAGLSEVVVPLLLAGRVAGVLFAGPRRPGTVEVQRRAPGPSPDPALPAWTRREAETAMECLRQLAARLSMWLEQAGAIPGIGQPSRRERILAYLERHCGRPLAIADLARHLGLSSDRTTHAVKEACGRGFVALLTDLRLERAAALLRLSDLPVAELAQDTGFGSLSQFHRQFRRRYGVAPLRWRLGGV